MSNSICGGSHLNSNDPAVIRKELNLIRTNLCYVMGNFAPSYKVYTALLTQSGTDAPIATVLENTLGGTVVWTRADVGNYIAELSGGFDSTKTFTLITGGDVGSKFGIGYLDGINIAVEIFVSSTGATADLSGKSISIEIRVYP